MQNDRIFNNFLLKQGVMTKPIGLLEVRVYASCKTWTKVAKKKIFVDT